MMRSSNSASYAEINENSCIWVRHQTFHRITTFGTLKLA